MGIIDINFPLHMRLGRAESLMPILVQGWNLKKISANSSPLSSMLHPNLEAQGACGLQMHDEPLCG